MSDPKPEARPQTRPEPRPAELGLMGREAERRGVSLGDLAAALLSLVWLGAGGG